MAERNRLHPDVCNRQQNEPGTMPEKISMKRIDRDTGETIRKDDRKTRIASEKIGKSFSGMLQ